MAATERETQRQGVHAKNVFPCLLLRTALALLVVALPSAHCKHRLFRPRNLLPPSSSSLFSQILSFPAWDPSADTSAADLSSVSKSVELSSRRQLVSDTVPHLSADAPKPAGADKEMEREKNHPEADASRSIESISTTNREASADIRRGGGEGQRERIEGRRRMGVIRRVNRRELSQMDFIGNLPRGAYQSCGLKAVRHVYACATSPAELLTSLEQCAVPLKDAPLTPTERSYVEDFYCYRCPHAVGCE